MRRPFPHRCPGYLSPIASGEKSQSWLSPLGVVDTISMDEKMAHSGSVVRGDEDYLTSKSWRVYLTVLAVAGAIYLGCCVSPPSLMDDVDAIQAQIARNMLTSGDWVTARLDGVPYLEKAPLIYWIIAIFYKIFGVHDWAARIPIALSAMALSWLTAAFGVSAFCKPRGLYARLSMAPGLGI